MPLEDICVHVATPVAKVDDPDDLGDPAAASDGDETMGTPFDCCLFLPAGTEQASAKGGRQVKVPTLLMLAEDHLEAPVVLRNEDELDVVAPELNRVLGLAEDAAVRYQVQGSPQPLGRPGDDPLGFQATLKRVED